MGMGLRGIFGKEQQRLIVVEDAAIEITPEMAQKLIDSREKKRALVGVNVERLARAIRENKFRLNGEAIIVSDSGVLLDGSHRCTAVIKTKESIRAVVCVVPHDEAEKDFETIDSGAMRKASSFLSIDGVKYPNQIAAAVRAWMKFKKSGTYQSQYDPSAQEILAAYRDRADVWLEIQEGLYQRAAPSAAIGIIWGEAADPETRNHIRSFFARVRLGANLAEYSPELLLRERLSEQNGAKRMTAISRIGVTIKAWNAYAQGARPKLLKYAEGEAFPMPMVTVKGMLV